MPRRVAAVEIPPVVAEVRDELHETMRPPPLEDRLLAVEHVAELLDVTPKTIRRLALRGAFPKPIMIGQRNHWSKQEVQAWIATELAKRKAG